MRRAKCDECLDMAGRLVTGYGQSAGLEDGRHDFRVRTVEAAHPVDATRAALEPSALHPVVEQRAGYTGGHELPACNDPVLRAGELENECIDVGVAHAARIVSAAARNDGRMRRLDGSPVQSARPSGILAWPAERHWKPVQPTAPISCSTPRSPPRSEAPCCLASPSPACTCCPRLQPGMR